MLTPSDNYVYAMNKISQKHGEKYHKKNGKKRLIKLLARAFRGTFSLFVLECKHVCLSLFSKKGIVYVVCVVLRCVRVC